MKVLDINNDAQAIEDAVKMLKQDFVSVYSEMGYDVTQTKLDWHRIRTSTKGRELIDQLYAGKRHIQALTFVCEPKEEAQIKMIKPKEKSKVTKAVAKDTTTKKVTKPSSEDRGVKTSVAKQLIAGGETSAAVISEKSGVAIAYARTLLYQARKAAKVVSGL